LSRAGLTNAEGAALVLKSITCGCLSAHYGDGVNPRQHDENQERRNEMKNGVLAISLSIVMLAVISPDAFAQGGTWSLDSVTSNARFFQGSEAYPDSVNTGVARVTGKVKLDANNLDQSVVDLSVYPAGENWGAALSPEGNLPTGFVPDATEQTLLTFNSRRIVRTKSGDLQVIGDLTLTRVERSVTADPTEAYAGSAYSDPVIHTATRSITLLFPGLSAALAAGPLGPATRQHPGTLEVSGTAPALSDETFPGLLAAITETNWPPVLQNEKCDTPPAVGEDYSGIPCTGTLIAGKSTDNFYAPSVGEDYSGTLCTPAAGNRTTIVFDLKLVHRGSEPSVGMLSGHSTEGAPGN
jgi:polyisoprenoid-binding protein YceI